MLTPQIANDTSVSAGFEPAATSMLVLNSTPMLKAPTIMTQEY